MFINSIHIHNNYFILNLYLIYTCNYNMITLAANLRKGDCGIRFPKNMPQ